MRRSSSWSGGSESRQKIFDIAERKMRTLAPRRPAVRRRDVFQQAERAQRMRVRSLNDREVVTVDDAGLELCESGEMRASATATCRLSATRNVCVGGLLRKSSPAPALVRPSHNVMVTVAGRLRAIQTDTSLGSTRRRMGPARTNGSDTKVPLTFASRDRRGSIRSRHPCAVYCDTDAR